MKPRRKRPLLLATAAAACSIATAATMPLANGSILPSMIRRHLFVSGVETSSDSKHEANHAEQDEYQTRTCRLEGLVELLSNHSNAHDGYVYREVFPSPLDPVSGEPIKGKKRFWWRDDPSNLRVPLDYASDPKYISAPERSAGLWRMCVCNGWEGNLLTLNHGLDEDGIPQKSIWNRNGTDDDDAVSATSSELDQAHFCPLEAQACGVVVKGGDAWNVTVVNGMPFNTFDAAGGRTKCYAMGSSTAIVRNAWPILWMWFALLVLALASSAAGRQALHYAVIKIGSACVCLGKCCRPRSSDEASAPETPTPEELYDFGRAYNAMLVRNMLRAEARRRRIRQDRLTLLWARRELERSGEFNAQGETTNATHATTNSSRRRWWSVLSFRQRTDGRNDRNDTIEPPTAEFDLEATEVDTAEPSAMEAAARAVIEMASFRENKSEPSKLALRTKIYHQQCTRVPVEDEEATTSAADTTDDAICIICFAPFEEGDRVGNLPHCNHTFHAECLKSWIHRKNTCPICVQPIATAWEPNDNNLD